MRGDIVTKLAQYQQGQKLSEIIQIIAEEEATERAFAKRFDRAYLQADMAEPPPVLDTAEGTLGLRNGDSFGVGSSAAEAYPLSDPEELQ